MRRSRLSTDPSFGGANPVTLSAALQALFPKRLTNSSGPSSAWNVAMGITQGGMTTSQALGSLMSGRRGRRQERISNRSLATTRDIAGERTAASRDISRNRLRASAAEREAQRAFLRDQADRDREIKREQIDVYKQRSTAANQHALARLFRRGAGARRSPATQRAQAQGEKLPSDVIKLMFLKYLKLHDGDADTAMAHLRATLQGTPFEGGQAPATQEAEAAPSAVGGLLQNLIQGAKDYSSTLTKNLMFPWNIPRNAAGAAVSLAQNSDLVPGSVGNPSTLGQYLYPQWHNQR